MTGIIDYGVGNLFSLASSLRMLDAGCVVTNDADVIRHSDHIVLPGVGAFGDAMVQLKASGLIPALLEQAAAGKPFLGICLGMQLLFERSHEFGCHEGLSLIPGEVVSIREALTNKGLHYKVPQMGWNALDFVHANCPLLENVAQGDYVYYLNSYYVSCDRAFIAATSDYGVAIPGAVQRGNLYGVQFHPEKSGHVGLAILQSFLHL